MGHLGDIPLNLWVDDVVLLWSSMTLFKVSSRNLRYIQNSKLSRKHTLKPNIDDIWIIYTTHSHLGKTWTLTKTRICRGKCLRDLLVLNTVSERRVCFPRYRLPSTTLLIQQGEGAPEERRRRWWCKRFSCRRGWGTRRSERPRNSEKRKFCTHIHNDGCRKTASGLGENIVWVLKSATWRIMFTLAGYCGHHNHLGGTESSPSGML